MSIIMTEKTILNLKINLKIEFSTHQLKDLVQTKKMTICTKEKNRKDNF